MRVLCSVLASGLLLCSATAQPLVQPAPSALLQIQEVQQWSDDQTRISLISDQVVYQVVVKEVEEKVLVNGVEITVKKTINENVPVIKKVVSQYPLNQVKATDISGKALSPEEMFKRLPPGTAVLVLPEGHKLPPSHQRLFNKDAVILTPMTMKPMKQ